MQSGRKHLQTTWQEIHIQNMWEQKKQSYHRQSDEGKNPIKNNLKIWIGISQKQIND